MAVTYGCCLMQTLSMSETDSAVGFSHYNEIPATTCTHSITVMLYVCDNLGQISSRCTTACQFN